MSEWNIDDKGQLFKQFKFKSFSEGFAFTSKVALLAEKYNHHPKIVLEYSTVSIFLISHDKKQITERDTELSNLIEDLYYK